MPSNEPFFHEDKLQSPMRISHFGIDPCGNILTSGMFLTE